MTESFFLISNYFMWGKNIENTQFLTLSTHHSDLPIDIKRFYISFSS